MTNFLSYERDEAFASRPCWQFHEALLPVNDLLKRLFDGDVRERWCLRSGVSVCLGLERSASPIFVGDHGGRVGVSICDSVRHVSVAALVKQFVNGGIVWNEI